MIGGSSILTYPSFLFRPWSLSFHHKLPDIRRYHSLPSRYPALWQQSEDTNDDMAKGELFRRSADAVRADTGHLAEWTLIVGDGSHERRAARLFLNSETVVTLLVLPSPCTPTSLHYTVSVVFPAVLAGGKAW